MLVCLKQVDLQDKPLQHKILSMLPRVYLSDGLNI